MYAYTIAKPIKTGEETDDFEGQQMIYVPRNKATGNVLFGWKSFNISYAHSYTDQRFTSPGQTLKSFQLGEASVSKDWLWKQFSVNLFFKADNIWNTSYQLTKGYAMPGRSYTCGMNFKFHSK
jgi:outer membrane cobalamin receptor